MKRTLLLCISVLFLGPLVIHAQGIQTVSGTVKDSDGRPIIGAVITETGNETNGVVTDANGHYSIRISDASFKGGSIKASCISYEQAVVDVAGRAAVNIILKDANLELDEVVVVGYGSMRRSDLTGSVSSVKIDEDDAARSTSIDQMLQGRAAGVQVLANNSQPDAGISIRIRGLNSFNSSTEPLYVVDGIILNPPTETVSVMTDLTDEAVNGLMGINPQDIESMEILKDASATAIYGAQGANGVVLITTKRASKGKPVIKFSAGVDISKRYKTMDVLNFDEFVDYWSIKNPEALATIYENSMKLTGLTVTPVYWQDYLMRTAASQRYHISISGKNEGASYTFSLGYSSKQGIIKRSDVEQYTVRLNLEKKITNKLTIGTKTNFGYVNSNLTQGANASKLTGATSLIISMQTSRPWSYDALDDYDYDDDEESESNRSSPDRWLRDTANTREEYRITPSLFAEYKILNWLSYKFTLAADYTDSERAKWKGGAITSSSNGSMGAVNCSEAISSNMDHLLLFNKKFGKHSISGTTGITTSQRTYRAEWLQGTHIQQYHAQLSAINSAPYANYSISETKYATLSYLARAVYNYQDRYVLTGTFRVDGSSKFRKENKFATFPSFAFAWRINQEPWFHSQSISSAKLRLGWGQVGNQSLSSYSTLTMTGTGLYADHTATNLAEGVRGIFPTNLPNMSLKWETTRQWNAGLDMSLWHGRLAFTVDAYDKNTYDLLYTKNISRATGFSSVWNNEGTISNRGLEFTFDAVPIKSGDFEIGLNGNISVNRNKIVSISSDNDKKALFLAPDRLEECDFFLGSKVGSSSIATYAANIFIVGQPMGLFYGLVNDGITQDGDTAPTLGAGGDPVKPGDIKYLDLDSNGYIDDNDFTIIGDPNPDFTYGFSAEVYYKHLKLSASFNGSYGNDIFNVNKIMLTDVAGYNRNILRDAFHKAWTPENTDTEYPSLETYRSTNLKYISSRFIEDGSFLRLSSLALSYSIPLKKSKTLKEISTSISAGNLYIWTKYSGWTPDVNSFGSDIRRMGIDVGSYPSSRTWSFDLRFTF